MAREMWTYMRERHGHGMGHAMRNIRLVLFSPPPGELLLLLSSRRVVGMAVVVRRSPPPLRRSASLGWTESSLVAQSWRLKCYRFRHCYK